MQKRHSDFKLYFNEQSVTTRDFVIPYISARKKINAESNVLEVGCGEGGNLLPFLELGCKVTGVDIAGERIRKARDFLKEYKDDSRLRLIDKDIFDCSELLDKEYDIIIMRDVIEHIYDQDRFMGFIKNHLGPHGLFFLAFPPWYNPFGGHQQICSNWFLSHTPYYHLLPKKLYKFLLLLGREEKGKIEELLEIKDTGISIERFRRICFKNHYSIADETFFLINPNYKVKFGLKPRKQIKPINYLPFIRNLVTTCVYYLLITK